MALLFMLGSMLCWGSWANTMKLCPGYRFQLFYWDYLLGLLAGVLAFGFTLGSTGQIGLPFGSAVLRTPSSSILFAMVGGAVFNVANLLLVAAIEIAGLAVAFPVGIGIALVVGALSSYVLSPQGSPLLLFGGLLLVTCAILFDSLAYKTREKQRSDGNVRGIVISLIAGVLMGTFYPLVSKSMALPGTPGPYATALFFVFGVIVCAVPLNALLMARPINGGEPVSIKGYLGAPGKWHWAGVLGGVIWMTGCALNFVASRVNFVGPAISYSIGQGATMVSALWGVFVWREFAAPSPRLRLLLIAMFTCFTGGLAAIALAPLYGK